MQKCPSEKIYICDQNFSSHSRVQSGNFPFYSQYILLELKRIAIANSHIFTWQTSNSTTFIGTPSSLTFRGYLEEFRTKRNIVLFLEDSDPSTFDKEGNSLISFINKDYGIKNAVYTKIKAPYSFRDLTDFPNGVIQEKHIFNISVFVRSLRELDIVLRTWKQSKFKGSSLYVFYSNRDMYDLSILSEIESFNSINNSRKINLFYLSEVDRIQIYKALQHSVFSIFIDHRTVFPFWAAKLGCYPLVLPQDVSSSYLKHLASKDDIPRMIESFWKYPKELMELVRQAKNIDFNVADIDLFLKY